MKTCFAIGQAVVFNQPTTAEIAFLMPAHAACMIFRAVSLLLYSQIRAATTAPMAIAAQPHGPIATTKLSAFMASVRILVRAASSVVTRTYAL